MSNDFSEAGFIFGEYEKCVLICQIYLFFVAKFSEFW